MIVLDRAVNQRFFLNSTHLCKKVVVVTWLIENREFDEMIYADAHVRLSQLELL